MKIYVVTGDQRIGLDVARMLGADVAVVEKVGVTAIYVLTDAGDNMLKTTMLKKHQSGNTNEYYYAMPAHLTETLTILEEKSEVEYLRTEDDIEEGIQLVTKKIKAAAVAHHDSAWLLEWSEIMSRASGIDVWRLDIDFAEKVRYMQNTAVISATNIEIRNMAETIVREAPMSAWETLAKTKGQEILNK